MNKKIFSTLSVDDIFFCPHSNLDYCSCRKPKIGMFLKAKKKWGINFKKSYVVGDRWKDISAGLKIGCKTIFIDKKYNERTPYIFDFKIKSLYGILKIL
jgi:D-glycero-D-manno-heptose 1,7-bisphosphate phosphatase